MTHGVPQGTCLQPILWLIYSNYMLALSNEDCTHGSRMRQEDFLFGEYCKGCRIENEYADDLQYPISGKDEEELVDSCNKILIR